MNMSVLALNSYNATMVKPEIATVAFKTETNKTTSKWEMMKSGNRSIVSIPEAVVRYESADSQDSPKSPRPISKNYCSYSSDVFFQKDMPQIAIDGKYMVCGTSYTKEELVKCRMVMQAAVNEVTCGTGREYTIDYNNHVEMAIAINSVKKYAAAELSETQEKVVNNAMQLYMSKITKLQKDALSGAEYIDDDTEALSEYYNKVRILDEVEIEKLNKLKQEMSKLTGRYYAPTQIGATAIVPTATNAILIKQLTDLFLNVNIEDEENVAATLKKYKKLMKPVYGACGYDSEDGSLKKRIKEDTAHFRAQIASVLLAIGYRTADYAV